MAASRFNRHGDRLLERYGMRVWRLGLDAGFSCPYRVGGRGAGGCTFCAPSAGLAPYQLGSAPQSGGEGLPVAVNRQPTPVSQAPAARTSAACVEFAAQASLAAHAFPATAIPVSFSAQRPASCPPVMDQVRRALGFVRNRYDAEVFFLYFQAYSCTNLPVPELEAVYGEAIAALEAEAPGSLRGIVVSTRPDCFDAEKAALLAGYARSGLEVWLELGLQSSNEDTLRRINRGHGATDYARAAREDMLETVRFAAECGLEGIKFHDLRLVRGCALADEYLAGEFTPIHPDRLPGLLADCFEILPDNVEIMRLCADFPSSSTIDPFPPPEKNRLYRDVEAELERRGTRQGSAIVAGNGGR